MILNKTIKTKVTTLEQLEEDCYQLFLNNEPLHQRKVLVETETDEEYLTMLSIFKNLAREQISSMAFLDDRMKERKIEFEKTPFTAMKFTTIYCPSIGNITLENLQNNETK